MKTSVKTAMFTAVLTAALIAAPQYSHGQKPATKAKGDRYMTRGEMAVKLSGTDYMKERIGALLNFAVGYNLSTLNRATMAPIIRSIKVTPYKLPPDGRTLFSLSASVDDPGGLSQILGVRADLSNLGKLSNTSLVDNGLWGDEKPSDGTYSLQTSASPKVGGGQKEVSVSVANKKGWLSVARTNVVIEKGIVVTEASSDPKIVQLDGAAKTLLTVRIGGTDGIDSVNRVIVDLSAVGGAGETRMHNDGSHGDAAGGDDTFSLEIMPSAMSTAGIIKLPVYVFSNSGAFARSEINIRLVKKG